MDKTSGNWYENISTTTIVEDIFVYVVEYSWSFKMDNLGKLFSRRHINKADVL